MKSVMAIDPGGTSGVCVRDDSGKLHSFELTKAHELWGYIADTRPDIVIVERFAASKIDVWGLYTVTLVGGVLALCQSLNIERFIHHPTFKDPWMKQATEELMAERGGTTHNRKHSDHEQDSRAHYHCWYFRSQNGTKDYQERNKTMAFSGQPLDL